MQHTIREAAAELGISAHTIRYYERLGLVEVPRDEQGHRAYDAATMRRLTFLVRMRSAGIGVADLQRYVDLIKGGEETVEERLRMMVRHREVICQRIVELQRALQATEYKIAAYGGHLSDEPKEHR